MEVEPVFPNLEVGQLAEMKTFEEGYRGAWFRCKIKDISPKKDEIKLEYYDFPGEVMTWTEIFQVPPYCKKSRHIKKQLMVRPRYPLMYNKNAMIAVASMLEVCVIVDGTWKVGDLVDWLKDGCYWSARIIKVLHNEEVWIQLTRPPEGEGKKYVAYCKDLRPSLEWSPGNGWTLLAVEGARLVFPSMQGTNSYEKDARNAAASPLHASSSSRISVTSSAVPIRRNAERQTSQEQKPASNVAGKASSSSDSISISQVEETEVDLDSSMPLNMIHEDTLEAPILDLEELANKVKWMKRLLQSDQSPSSWKFVEHHSPSGSTSH